MTLKPQPAKKRPSRIKILAKKFMAHRKAQRDAVPPVDSFFRRLEDAPRFAYFND